MKHCRTIPARLLWVVSVLALTVACLPKMKPAVVEMPTGEKVEVRQVRIWVYELTNLLAGWIEMAADDIREQADDPSVRLAALEWKAYGIPTLQRASFNPDPMIGFADVWLFVVQMQDFLESDRGPALFGEHVDSALKATMDMEHEILRFSRDKGGRPVESGTSDLIHQVASEYPIRSSISARPSVASALTERLKGKSLGAFAAVGTLVEGFDDLSDRLAIYGEQLPKQARWQAEILLFEAGLESVDVDALTADTARLGRAADHLVVFTDDASALIDQKMEHLLPQIERIVASIDIEGIVDSADEMAAKHLAVALAAVTVERGAILAAVTEERIAALADAERMANDVVDRSFEQVDLRVDAAVDRLIPVGAALMAGPFVLGLLLGLVLRRRAPQA